RIATNSAGSPHIVALNGTGTSSKAILLSAAAIDFGTQQVGAPATHRTVTATNVGISPVNISLIASAAIPTSNGVIHTIAGTGVPGCAGDGGPATTAELHGPSGIAFDSAGNLFIADSLNHAVRRMTPGGAITTITSSDHPNHACPDASASSAHVDTPI